MSSLDARDNKRTKIPLEDKFVVLGFLNRLTVVIPGYRKCSDTDTDTEIATSFQEFYATLD